MALDKKKLSIILQRVGAAAVCALLLAGSWFFIAYESARSRDAQTLSRILEFQSALASYAQRHGVYPSMGTAPMTLGTAQAECLSTQGFTSANNAQCRKKSYGFFSMLPGKEEQQIAVYSSLDSDAITLCTNKDGCPLYKIDFILESNSIAQKGIHSVSQNGFQ